MTVTEVFRLYRSVRQMGGNQKMSVRPLLPYLHLVAFSDWSRPLNAPQIRDVIGGVVLLGTVV